MVFPLAIGYTWACVELQTHPDGQAVDKERSCGCLLRRLRKAHDLTEVALARQAYRAVDTIKKIEQGVRARRCNSRAVGRLQPTGAVPAVDASDRNP